MKLFISSDMEGTAGVAAWPETEKGNADYEHFRRQMSKEVAAACNGAYEGGAKEILVKDAHDFARNIVPSELPRGIKLVRCWEKGPESMMAGIGTGCDAAAMTGYHSAAFTLGNPLAHTMNTQNQWVRWNGDLCSEFLINATIASCHNVPVIFLSGDAALCESAKKYIPAIKTAPVSEGYYGASISLQPEDAADLIKENMKEAVKGYLASPEKCIMKLPESFDIEVEFKELAKARLASFYPGAKAVGSKGVEFHTNVAMEAVTFLHFVL